MSEIQKLSRLIPPPARGADFGTFRVTRVVAGEMPDGSAGVHIDFFGTEIQAQYPAGASFAAGDAVLCLYSSPRVEILHKTSGGAYDPVTGQKGSY